MGDKKKYSGYGYHGGGRKPLPEEQKKKYITISVSGQPAEIERLKARAQEEHKTVSRFILDNINEALMINEIAFGVHKAIDRDKLSDADLKKLTEEAGGVK